MTLRNIGIVFSPTLGIPAGIFSELVSHFGAIFDAEPEDPETEARDTLHRSQDNTGTIIVPGTGTGTGLKVPGEAVDDTVKRKRNSMLYQAAGADAMLGIGGRSLDPSTSRVHHLLYRPRPPRPG
jgi:RalA-binding protein 1